MRARRTIDFRRRRFRSCGADGRPRPSTASGTPWRKRERRDHFLFTFWRAGQFQQVRRHSFTPETCSTGDEAIMPTTYTVCFCGTACSRDEGEETRSWDKSGATGFVTGGVVSDKGIYDDDTGYIPVRIHRDISNSLLDTKSSVTVRGVGENDWHNQMDASDPLCGSPLDAPGELRKEFQKYSTRKNQRNMSSQMTGWAAAALALHGANVAASSKADQYNFIGHSRGAVETIMAAWFLYAYGGEAFKNVPINIFAIDPVPGPGTWYGILTQLPPNVACYVGVYAWDHLDDGFSALVPRPNARMTSQRADRETKKPGLGGTWETLADKCQLTDPLAPAKLPQPQGYRLYACRGRHGTVSGNITRDGKYNASNRSADVAAVPRLVYKLARAYLTLWETPFHTGCRVRENAKQLRERIHGHHADFDAMAGGEKRTSVRPGRPYVRRVSSISGSNPSNWYYLEDVVGAPPERLAYPCTTQRTGGGWVKWRFL
jgi:hypothetical protein